MADSDFQLIDPPRNSWGSIAAFTGAGVLVALALLFMMRGGEEEPVEAAHELTPIESAVPAVAGAPGMMSPAGPALDEAPPITPTTSDAGNPNILGASAEQAEVEERVVPRAEMERFKTRAIYAERQNGQLKDRVSDLEAQVRSLQGQLQAERTAALPPPPTETEQIIDTLRPVLSSNHR